MVKYEIKSNPTGQYYLPKEVREELGPKLSMICNAKAAIIFCPNEPIEVILQSLAIIAQDLRHRMDIQEREKRPSPENESKGA
jgi:hypothetical protein